METFLGYLAAALIGVSLGLFGGGGSILTIPVLVYLFKIEPTMATGYSLIIVGSTAVVGAVRSARYGMIDFKNGLLFSIPSMIAIYLARHYVLPTVPYIIMVSDQLTITRDSITMALFSLLMVFAAIRMIRQGANERTASSSRGSILKITVQGFTVGILTGVVGAGGGFLILPALVLWGGIPMKKAIGTSLFIIAINSLIGSLGDIGTGSQLDYSFAFLIAALATTGVFAGGFLSRHLNADRLKIAFGWFALSMALFIIGKEVFF
ncbi:MAG TPA: sulfite exporter TauE/SafE family protein [Cyclobacteriaceae bacterium]|nr:sulfite exporter TauE/SafE family protein [Cyclobacteriaceae bacterium]